MYPPDEQQTYLVPCPVASVPFGQIEGQPRRTVWSLMMTSRGATMKRTTRAARKFLVAFEFQPGNILVK